MGSWLCLHLLALPSLYLGAAARRRADSGRLGRPQRPTVDTVRATAWRRKERRRKEGRRAEGLKGALQRGGESSKSELFSDIFYFFRRQNHPHFFWLFVFPTERATARFLKQKYALFLPRSSGRAAACNSDEGEGRARPG